MTNFYFRQLDRYHEFIKGLTTKKLILLWYAELIIFGFCIVLLYLKIDLVILLVVMICFVISTNIILITIGLLTSRFHRWRKKVRI